ncbi:MAG: FAD-binding protein [Candidatus Shapirobacteria bacterium]|nr:FAD-binding protein [Candidatus Shapirobacteria bacterium]MDD4410252.1 FAD-binding protein [Candidatus Shapirobacteria bacterium]
MDIQQNVLLAPYTTVKIGGPADFFIHTKNSEELIAAIKYGQDNNLPITILGNGSNVLISDSGIRGLVIKNDSEEIELLPDNKVKVSSGTQLSSLINFTLDHNLLGLEEFAYIPSTVGGAIIGDIHGVNKNHFSKFVDSVEKYNDFIISTVLKLIPGNSTSAKAEVSEIIQKKSQVQLMNSLGSVFKNPEGHDPAGMIIDQQLNLRGYSIGDAQINPKHGNFIINNGHATAKDYLALISLIQSKTQEILGFQFELEIKLLGKF